MEITQTGLIFISMEITQTGWVVINIGHPTTGNSYIVGETFSSTRSKAIKHFVSGSGKDWRYWREKYNFRVVRSEQRVVV